MEELGTAGEDSGMGGCKPKAIRYVIQGGGTGRATILVGDLVADPPHGTGPGKLPIWGRKLDNGETAKDTGGGGMVIPTAGGNGGRGSI